MVFLSLGFKLLGVGSVFSKILCQAAGWMLMVIRWQFSPHHFHPCGQGTLFLSSLSSYLLTQHPGSSSQPMAILVHLTPQLQWNWPSQMRFILHTTCSTQRRNCVGKSSLFLAMASFLLCLHPFFHPNHP